MGLGASMPSTVGNLEDGRVFIGKLDLFCC